MPPRPPWHARAAAIHKDVEALRVPVLDRTLVERVFSIERRTAQRLLGRILALTELAAADYAGFAARFALEQEP